MKLLNFFQNSKESQAGRLSRFWMVLLFISVLCLSIIYHLPASWLFTQSVFQKQIPKVLLMNGVQGSVWNGSATLLSKTLQESNAVVDLGELKWNVDFLGLLKASIVSHQVWQLDANSRIDFALQRDLLSSSSPIKVSGLRADIDIGTLLKRLHDLGFITVLAEGQLIAHDVGVVLDSSRLWPIEVSGALQIKGLSALGVVLPTLNIVPSLKGEIVVFDLKAEANGWHLEGDLQLNTNHSYNVVLSVKADTPVQMPDWSQMMTSKTPTHATLAEKGRW